MQKRILERRAFLSALCALGVLPLGELVDGSAKGRNISDAYEGLKSRRYLGKVKVETEVDGQQIFLEGPAVDGHGKVFFTNIPANQILLWDPSANHWS